MSEEQKNPILYVSLVTGSALASVIYDYGYFLELGISLTQVPASVTDHVSNWVLRLPYLVAFIGGAFTLATIIVRVVKYPKKELRIHRWLHKHGKRLVILLFAFFFVVLFFHGLKIGEMVDFIMASVCAAFILGFWYESSPEMNMNHKTAIAILKYGIPSMLISFVAGNLSARDEIGLSHWPYNRYALENTKDPCQEEVEILRDYEHWLLARKNYDEFSWINKDTVRTIRKLNKVDRQDEQNRKDGITCS